MAVFLEGMFSGPNAQAISRALNSAGGGKKGKIVFQEGGNAN